MLVQRVVVQLERKRHPNRPLPGQTPGDEGGAAVVTGVTKGGDTLTAQQQRLGEFSQPLTM